MKKWGLNFVLIISVIFLVACGNSASSESIKEVKIGALHPLSGGLALEGQEMRDAVKLAVDQRNENGGIKSLNGAKVELIEADHEGSPEKGVSEVQKLDREGVSGIVGAYSSGVALPATQEAERGKVPFVVDIGSANEITERGFKYTYRLQPAATTFSKNFLEIVKNLNDKSEVKLKTVSIVHEDSVFGTSIADAIKAKINEYDLEIVNILPHAASAADLSTTINKLGATKPDIVVMTTYLRDGVMLVEGLNNSNFVPKAIIGVANGAFSNATFLTEHSKINNNIMDVNYTINQKSELAVSVEKEYKDKFGKGLGPNGAYSYTAAVVLLDAIERAGSVDREKIQQELSKTKLIDHILAAGEIEFDEKGQNINARAVLNQIQNEKSLIVGPDEFKVEEPIYPQNK